MTVPLMDPHSQYAAVREQIMRAIGDVIDSGRFILGPRVAEVESTFAAQVGVAHGVGVANGTDALLIALRALGVQPGDEVICPAFTFYATAESIAAVNAIPVFADIEDETYCLDPAAVEAAITPRTRAVIAVDLFGHPAPMPALAEICKRHGLALLEDAAQAYGAALDDVRCGAFGDAATFSFFPTKNLPCFGDGGLITTDSADVERMCRVLRFHGSEDKQTFTHVGYNSRLDELQAAIVLQLRPLLDGWNDGRIAVAARYGELGLGDYVTTPAVAPGARHVYHLYMARSQERDRLVTGLKAAGIGTGTYYTTPLHLQSVFAHLGWAEGSLPVTERCARECFVLPMSPTLGEDAQREVVQAVEALAPARA